MRAHPKDGRLAAGATKFQRRALALSAGAC
jgi:hypothetical protein